jgi:hypothetical protein
MARRHPCPPRFRGGQGWGSFFVRVPGLAKNQDPTLTLPEDREGKEVRFETIYEVEP